MQATYKTTPNQNPCGARSRLRIAVPAQLAPRSGALNSARFNPSEEQGRVMGFLAGKIKACAPEATFVYEVFAGDKKIGICVAQSPAQALFNATQATTRKTASKLDVTCDFENLTVRRI